MNSLTLLNRTGFGLTARAASRDADKGAQRSKSAHTTATAAPRSFRSSTFRRLGRGIGESFVTAGGGQITVKLIPGEGHKVSPSFFECQKLVDFVIAHGTR